MQSSRSSSSVPGANINLSDNTDFTADATRKFNAIKRIKNQRAPTAKPVILTQNANRNSKQAQVIIDAGIAWDSPLTPVQLAAIRSERALKEKQRLPPSARLHLQQQLTQQQQTIQVGGVATAATVVQQQQQQIIGGSTNLQPQQQQIIGSVVVSKGSVGGVVSTGSIIVSQATLVSAGVGLVSAPSAITSGVAPQVLYR